MARRDFVDRHVGPSSEHVRSMLDALDYARMSDFIGDVLPDSIKLTEKFGSALPTPISEVEVIKELKLRASENIINHSLIGMGYYGTVTPPVVLRNVLENPAWYTAYTPYQPEISQGRLEALFAFQTMVSEDRKSTRLNSSHVSESRMPSSA